MNDYTTLQEGAAVEIERVKRSRFIGSTSPCRTADEATAFVQQVREAYHDARHHAFAWRFGPDGASSRASDDGEPHHSAGTPILREIEGRDLTDVVVVVTRYYGGVKLGTGGLARAYGAAAAAALDRSVSVTIPIRTPVYLRFGYELVGAVQQTLHHLSLTAVDAAYGVDVQMTLHVEPEQAQEVVARLVDASAGAAVIEVGEPTEGRPSSGR